MNQLTEAKVAPWIERMARVGYVAKGVLYVTIGALAVLAALGLGGDAGTDKQGAMTEIYALPFGSVLVAMLAAGLLGYAVWRIVEGIRDPEHRGTSAKGIALRIGSLARGVVHLALAAAAVSLLVWQRQSNVGRDQAEQWAARALALPGGVYVLWAVAAVLVAYGAYQLVRACKKHVDKHLRVGQLGDRAQTFIFGVSRFGIAARGIVFGTIGILIGRAAAHHDADASGGIADSMHRLVQLGKWPFFAIAVGVVAYGTYQFICAKYRRIQC